MKLINIKNSKGVTLVELLIVIGIMGVLTSLGFMLFFFGNDTFKKGNEQYDLQFNLRQASDKITRELQYSTEIKLLSAIPVPYDPERSYISLINSNKTIEKVFNYGGTSTPETIIDASSHNITFNLEFQKANNNSLLVSLQGQNMDTSRDYKIDTKIDLPNIGLGAGIDDTVTDPIIAIEYKPAEIELAETLPVEAKVDASTSNTPNLLTVYINKKITACTLTNSSFSPNPTWTIQNEKTLKINISNPQNNKEAIFKITDITGVNSELKVKMLNRSKNTAEEIWSISLTILSGT